MKALVTGAANGLGLALSEKLLEAGAQVLASDRDEAGLNALANNTNVLSVCADLGVGSDVNHLGKVANENGPFDLVVMNAGLNFSGRFEEIPLAEHLAILQVNWVSVMELTATLVRNGSIATGGSIIFVSSLSHYVGYPGAASYAASKSGLAVFAKSISKPLKKKGINVLTVFPGPMDTDQASQNAPSGATAKDRMAPDEAAALILAAAGQSGVLVPGRSAKAAAFIGRFLPWFATGIMRRSLFEKLPGSKS